MTFILHRRQNQTGAESQPEQGFLKLSGLVSSDLNQSHQYRTGVQKNQKSRQEQKEKKLYTDRQEREYGVPFVSKKADVICVDVVCLCCCYVSMVDVCGVYVVAKCRCSMYMCVLHM